ncbi:MAG: hypothetical protein JEZ04_08010 [Spirochaetales bacterium]|nr:hypothetical protein [Spirochaetales bacterium]
MIEKRLNVAVAGLYFSNFEAQKRSAEINVQIISERVQVDVPESEIDHSARTAEALMRLGGELKFQAAALKCWPEFQTEFSMAPCTAVSYLNDRGFPTSCEGEVTMLRISGDGSEICILEGEVVGESSKPYCGSGGWIGNLKSRGQNYSTSQLLQAITDYGLDHHYPILHGHWEDVLRELASWTGMKVLEMPDAQDYLV